MRKKIMFHKQSIVMRKLQLARSILAVKYLVKSARKRVAEFDKKKQYLRYKICDLKLF